MQKHILLYPHEENDLELRHMLQKICLVLKRVIPKKTLKYEFLCANYIIENHRVLTMNAMRKMLYSCQQEQSNNEPPILIIKITGKKAGHSEPNMNFP